MKRKIAMLLLVFFLFIIYIYTLIINYLPDRITIFEGENIVLKTFLGINLKSDNDSITASVNSNEKTINKAGSEKISVNLFNKLLIKNIDVSVLPKTTVIPVGNIAGVKLYTNGVLVVGMSEIEGKDNEKYKPYEHSGIVEGDTILKIV